jgi:hypothetical protein
MIIRSIANSLRRLRANERGTVSATMGILMIPMVGALGLGFEVSHWYMTTRSMQNAADAAVIAAATNGGSNYDVEAKAVAATYGFVDGTNHVSVLVSNTATCPDGSTTCYGVTISGLVPLLLSQVVGFKGDTNANGILEKKLSSASVAKAGTQPQNLCLLALANSGAPQGIRTNGAPVANFNGCNVMSDTAAQCNGSNLGAGLGLAHGTSSGCGATPVSNVPKVDDPYSSLASNIPQLSSSGCTSYPQETTQGNHVTQYPASPAPPLPAGVVTLNGPTTPFTLNLSGGNNFACGDQVLQADVTITAPANTPAVLIIENGRLDLNGHSFTTSSGSGVTLVFSGDPANGTYSHAPTDTKGGGTLDLAAPTSGTWSGVAIYQDPKLKTGVDISAAGNSPTWNVTGLVYAPNASVTINGAINKATNGQQCLVLVADNFVISGTAGILQTDIGQCSQAGLTMPTAKTPGSTVLVL